MVLCILGCLLLQYYYEAPDVFVEKLAQSRAPLIDAPAKSKLVRVSGVAR